MGSDSSAELVAENQTLKAAVEALKREVQDLQEEMRLRKDIELQLVNSQKMEALGQMAAGIAHEINTPAQFIGDHLYFVKESIHEILSLDETQEGPSEFVRENLPMAGRLTFDTQEGVGTTFFLLLPISADSQTSSSQIPYCKGWLKISS